MGYPKTLYVQHVTDDFFGRAFEDRPAGYAVRYDMHDDEAQAEITRLRADLATERALADRLYNEHYGGDWFDAAEAYRKARGL